MTIMELGALGEFISVFVVVGTLIYLASEVRQTRRALLATAYQARAEMQVNFSQRLFDSKYIPAITLKVDAGEALTDEEARRWTALARSTYRLHENVFYQHRQGFLEAGALATTSRMIGINIQRTANRTFWEASKEQFNADFVRWVDEIVGRGDP